MPLMPKRTKFRKSHRGSRLAMPSAEPPSPSETTVCKHSSALG